MKPQGKGGNRIQLENASPRPMRLYSSELLHSHACFGFRDFNVSSTMFSLRTSWAIFRAVLVGKREVGVWGEQQEGLQMHCKTLLELKRHWQGIPALATAWALRGVSIWRHPNKVMTCYFLCFPKLAVLGD